jgi:hypothetical protein
MGSQDRRHLSKIEMGTLAASALAIAFGVAYAGPSPHMFGTLFGLAQDQTVRVSIVNVDNPDFRTETQKFPPDPCMVQYKFFDSAGSIVAQTEYAKILPGASLSFDLKFEDLKIGDVILASPKATSFGAPRAQLRVATYLLSSGDFSHKALGCPSDYKYLKLSVEVFDVASGKTTFMVPTDSFVPAVQ